MALIESSNGMGALQALGVRLLLRRVGARIGTRPISGVERTLECALPKGSVRNIHGIPGIVPTTTFIHGRKIVALGRCGNVIVVRIGRLSKEARTSRVGRLIGRFPRAFLTFANSSNGSIGV